ncbi:MAG: S8 family serine peptidase [Candidatus Altiarchaeota archaeon]|nr:S8 family serine peptidase [Candidatus Altiarchaeota archaeon]
MKLYRRKTTVVITLISILSLMSSAEIIYENQKNEKLAFNLEMQDNEDKIPVIILLDKKILSERQNFVLQDEQNPFRILSQKKIQRIFSDKVHTLSYSKKDVELREIKKISRLKRRYELIEAISAELTKGEIVNLSENPYVKRIYYDHIIHALPTKKGGVDVKLTTSIQSIGAYYVQNYLGYTGKNVTVAVIDTGIDYNHSDLGGCFGSGCRVKDGYDFVNGDSDPMDDNGHGTHCAGIVSANGGVTGVAPDANLLAVKVLDSGGSGTTSGLLAGIDWAVANGADVISLSLGSSEQPNDGLSPLNLIVNAAVKKGVNVVIAVGNEGPGTGTISYSASAEKVISVGASNDKGTVRINDDTIPDFSCRGPSAFGRFDPDLVAPGVGIYSTWPGGGYYSASGTSMATPHVAGVAALLLEYSGGLTPDEIKSLLIHSTGGISGHVFESGTGLINVTRAIESHIEAAINNDDAWEESVIPGMNTTAVLTIRNNEGYPINLSLTLTSLTDIEGDYSILETCFEFPASVLINPGEEKEVEIKFIAQSNAQAGIYGSVLVMEGNSKSIRMPVAITIPLFDTGIVHGTVDDECSIDSPESCGSNPSSTMGMWGDWRFYQLISHNGTSVGITLNWSSSIDDLDLYLYAPNGVLADVSGEGNTTGEHILLSNPVYHEYWVAVYAYDVKSAPEIDFNFTVSYPSSLRVEPSSWQGSLNKGVVGLINFSLVNDGTLDSNLDLDAVILQKGGSKLINSHVGYSNPYSVVWKKSTGGLDLSDARYMNASLRWSNPSNDLDLYFVYNQGLYWYTSRFRSEHRNDLFGVGEEDLEEIDIRYYLERYSDVGIGIKNTGGYQSYSLELNFMDESSWNAAGVVPSSISSLSPYETKTVQVSINTGSLTEGETYDSFLLIKDNSDELAKVPIRLSICSATTTTTTSSTTSTSTTSTTSSSTTTTTLQDECTLGGDYPPCDEVTLTEVVDFINLWSQDQSDLTDAINLVNAWAAS